MTRDFFESTVGSSATFLGRWQGAQATVLQMSSSLRVLSIVLWRPAAAMEVSNLCILVPDPLWMKGPFQWSDSARTISVAQASATEARDSTRRDKVFVVRDNIADFTLVAESLEVKENLNLR